MTESLFPDVFPTPPPRNRPTWKPTRDCRIVLEALANGPRGEDELFLQLAGEVTPQRVSRAIDALAKNGLVRDTGRRTSTWGREGRHWIWELVPALSESEVS